MGDRPRRRHDRPHARHLRAPAEPRAHHARPAAGRRRAHASARPRRLVLALKAVGLLARPVRAAVLAARHGVRRRPTPTSTRRCPCSARWPCSPRSAPSPAWSRSRGPGLRLVAGGLVALAAVWVLGLGAYPALLQRFRVTPNELAAERPFIEHNIRMTRQAYGLDRIVEQRVPRRRDPRRARARAERGHDQEHPPVGLPPAAAHVRPAPGDPDLLQVRRRGQRPLHRERRVPAAHAVAARAVVPAPAVAGSGSTST